jgi:hypothetical protein
MKWYIVAERLGTATKPGQAGRKVAFEVIAQSGPVAKAMGQEELRNRGLERVMTITTVTKK